MKWVLVLAFLTFDEHAGEFVYSAGKPWTITYDTRAECLSARDEAVEFAIKHQRTERDVETGAVSICMRQRYPSAASLPLGMQRPSHASPRDRYPMGSVMCPVCGRGTWSEGCFYPEKPPSCPDDDRIEITPEEAWEPDPSVSRKQFPTDRVSPEAKAN
jgi:hypothetical protein